MQHKQMYHILTSLTKAEETNVMHLHIVKVIFLSIKNVTHLCLVKIIFHNSLPIPGTLKSPKNTWLAVLLPKVVVEY